MEGEDSCTYNNREYNTGYKTEGDKRYWLEGGELFGIK